MFGWMRKKVQPPHTAHHVLMALRNEIELKNIPVVMDDFDAGYDMAIDEVLALIDDALNPSARNDDVTYGEK
jgi:hypothetical protein